MTSIYLNEDDCQNLTSILYLCSIQDDETKDFYHKIIIMYEFEIMNIIKELKDAG